MEKRQESQTSSPADLLTSFLASKRMRKTPERYEILRVAGMADGIFTIDSLMQLMLLHATFQVSRATLFNSMELFCEAGLMLKHPLATAAHYELRRDNLPKAYTICRQCNNISRVSVGTARLPLQNLHVRYFSIDDTIVYMHGLCRKCQAKKRNEAKKKKNINKQPK